jgi:endoglucanase
VVALFLLLLVTFGVGCSGLVEHDANRDTTGHRNGDAATIEERDADTVAARRAVDEFFRRYVAADGRVIRHDQGGDTVSEAQAYAMTMSAAVSDEQGFRKVWQWTADRLQRDDGLFAWRWHHGRIVSDEPATDADLWIAGALSIAATRFDDPSLAQEALEIGDAILRLATTEVAGRPVLVAGPWARHDGVVNPSYLTTVLMTPLWRQGQHEWAAVAATSRQLLDDLTADAPHLAPDLAQVDSDGTNPTAVPHGKRISGWEAVRIPVQMAADCDPLGREIAARTWPFLLARDVQVANVYSLQGDVVDPGQHAVAWVGAAGAAIAAGEVGSADVLLERATSADRSHPTYYGAAWLALGRLWLTTDLLGGCAGDPIR